MPSEPAGRGRGRVKVTVSSASPDVVVELTRDAGTDQWRGSCTTCGRVLGTTRRPLVDTLPSVLLRAGAHLEVAHP